MTDADRFLATIVAAPDDDVPRLVFADWLEEHGDTDRAEFIRLQIAETTPENRRRADALLAANRSRWVVAGIPGVQTFSRGFVDFLHISADDLLLHADRIGAAAPIVGLRISAAANRTVQLVRIPWLARLRTLDILNDSMGTKLSNWFQPGLFPGLRALNLRNNRLWSDHVGAFAKLAANLPELERLNLSGNPIGDDGLANLAAPALRGLRELVVSSDGIDDEYRIGPRGIAGFANSPIVPPLRSLVLENQLLGEGGFLELVRSPAARSLEDLDVSRNGIGQRSGAWVDALVNSTNLDRLKTLVFRGNVVSRDAIAILLWERLRSGCTIDFRGCEIEPQARRRLLESEFSSQISIDNEEPT